MPMQNWHLCKTFVHLNFFPHKLPHFVIINDEQNPKNWLERKVKEVILGTKCIVHTKRRRRRRKRKNIVIVIFFMFWWNKRHVRQNLFFFFSFLTRYGFFFIVTDMLSLDRFCRFEVVPCQLKKKGKTYAENFNWNW